MAKIEISDLMASCLQRMLVDEIDNQRKWKLEDERRFGKDNNMSETRENIIKECKDVQEQLRKQGYPIHIKCY